MTGSTAPSWRRAGSSVILWTFRYARAEEDVVEAMRKQVTDLLSEIYGMPRHKGLRSLAMVMRYILEVTDTGAERLEELLTTEIASEASEVLMTTAEKLRQEGHEAGLEEGLSRGQRAVLLKQLGLRFGTIPPSARATIERADAAALDLFSGRILSAKTLAEVLAPA